MDILALTEFFKWCTIINAGLLIVAWLILMAMPGFVYRMHNRFFDISRETFDTVMYSTFAVYKVIFIVFNVVPWMALLITG